MIKRKTDIDDAFKKSKLNPFSKIEYFDKNLESHLLEVAKRLQKYMSSIEIKKVWKDCIEVHTYSSASLCFQRLFVRFTNNNGEYCTARFSIPVNFQGSIRIWTENFDGDKVWITMNMIIKNNLDSVMLFDFFGKITKRYSSSANSIALFFNR